MVVALTMTHVIVWNWAEDTGVKWELKRVEKCIKGLAGTAGRIEGLVCLKLHTFHMAHAAVRLETHWLVDRSAQEYSLRELHVWRRP